MSVATAESRVPNISVNSFDAVSFAEEFALGKLQANLGSIVKQLLRELDDTSRRLISLRSVEQFRNLRVELFPVFVKLSLALGNVVMARLDKSEHSVLVQESFSELQQEFGASGQQYFSDDDYQEVMFCISTLKAAHLAVPDLSEIPPRDKQADLELASKFGLSTLWSQFNLECLKLAFRGQERILPEIMSELVQGLREAVRAYAYTREAMEQRDLLDRRYSQLTNFSWDNDDEALANSK